MNPKRIFLFFCLTIFLFGIFSGEARAASSSEAFEAANKEFKALLADDALAGRRDSWENLAAKFSKIQKNSGKGDLAPRALFMYARCMEELGLRSRGKADFRAACESFAGVASKYTKSSLADDALLRKAVIERDYLKSPDTAQKTLEKLLAEFKNGDMRGKAKTMLDELKNGAGADTPGASGSNAPDSPKVVPLSAAPEDSGERILRSITVRASSSKAQVEIELSRGGGYLYGYSPGKSSAGQAPYLILEFEDSRKAADVATLVSVPKGPVSGVRTTDVAGAASRAAFTRVELLLSKDCVYTFSSQANPARLVVDVAFGGAGSKRAGGGNYGGGGGKSVAARDADDDDIDRGGGKPMSAEAAGQLGLNMNTIMVDAGHGGKDPGAAGNGIKESALVFKLGKLVGAKLKAKGFNVLYTRSRESFISLEKRSELANSSKVDMFLSLHVNANNDSGIWGVEAYYLDVARSKGAVRVAARENAVTEKEIGELQVILTDLLLNSKTSESKTLAALMVKSMDRSIKAGGYPVRDNGVRSAPFYVLMGARMPSVLVEIGYCTNPAEAKRLLSDKYLDSLSDGIVNGIVAYRNKLRGG